MSKQTKWSHQVKRPEQVEETSGHGSKGKCGKTCFNCGQSEVSVAKTKIVADVIVVKREHCLLGYSTTKDLGILHVDLAETLRTGNYNTVDGIFVGQLKTKYPNWIGKVKGYQLKLHIDPSVKMRRVPFSLKDKVTAKVNELLEKAPKHWRT